MNRYSYLFRNMALFTVSNFVSKILVFCLVPFYTSVLTTQEYGIADVMQTTLLLLVPLLSINAGEAALRFSLEETESRSSILLIGLKKVLYSVLAVETACICLFILSKISIFPFADGRLFLFFGGLYLCNSLYEFMLLYCQGIEAVPVMMAGSISCTLLVILSNIYFLLIAKTGLSGYLHAQMISFAGAFLIMFIFVGGLSHLKAARKHLRQGETTALSKEMHSYGLSMLLYAVANWINNAIDRYFILFMLTPAENGLYGIAYKIPAILTTFQRIFAQSWQMSAVKEYKGADRESFFSDMFGIYEAVLVLSCAGIIWLLKPLSTLLFRKAFFSAWMLTPPLLISVIFGALEGFLGSICLAFKDGGSMGRATGIGAMVNIILNFLLIPFLGSFGAALATLCSYFVMFFLAFRSVLSHAALKTRYLRDGLSYILLIVESGLIIGSVWLYPLWNAIICLILFIMYLGELKAVLRKLMFRTPGPLAGK